jgi:hypothetical protein
MPPRRGQIGGRRNDGAVVAAEFEQRATEASRDARADGAAHAHGSGGRYERDARVVDECFTDGTVAQHDGREVGRGIDATGSLDRECLHGERGERGLLRRLPHDRVAAHQESAAFDAQHRHREVGRSDHADHAEGMPRLHHAVAGALGRDREAVQLAGQTDGEVADVDHLLDFAESLAADLARLDRHERAEVVLVLPQELSEHADQLAAARRRCGAPRGERVVGPAHRVGDVGRARPTQ